MPYFVSVILPLALDKLFTYSISAAEFDFIRPGMRIAVPFGKTKMYTSLAIELHRNKPELYEAKEIHEILDENPVVTVQQILHWQWLSKYYMCSLGDVFRSAMPSALLLESETQLVSKQTIGDVSSLNDGELLLYEALQTKSSINISEVSQIINKKNALPTIQKLIELGLIVVEEEMIEKFSPKVVKYIKLDDLYNDPKFLEPLINELSRAPKQRDVVMSYFSLSQKDKNPISVKTLLENSGASTTTIKSLVQKNIFTEYSIQEDRVNFDDRFQNNKLNLSLEQNDAFLQIKREFETKDVVLLHGITASGKTEIYMKLIEDAIADSGQVLYLVPEIALTTQLVTRLTAHFGNKVAVYHSKYSNNERVEVWHQVLKESENAQIIIGARSAMFLPFKNLSLVIVDEEHEATYKQIDPAPRYNARDAVSVLAKEFSAKVVLGSATPSIESYHNADIGKFGIVALNKRFGNSQLPAITLIDIKEKHHKKQMVGHFSDALVHLIADRLEKGEQVILFQNRRGFSPVVECITCGHVPHCSNCDVSLTFHKNKNQLRCHYCGYTMANPTNCHECGSLELSTKGFGTEQVQLELSSLFPKAKIGRMDQDTTRGKFGFERVIDSFKNREVDILVGTQMLAKGLDFENVTLVGIMNADNMLYHQDYRALERTFQMLTQVSGRAGRAEKVGEVIIQTYNPAHPIIQQVLDGNYDGMYLEQLHERKIYKYPPFFKVIKLIMRNRDFEKNSNGAKWLAEVLRQNLPFPVLGPEEPAISRIRNEYIQTVIIKYPQNLNGSAIKKTIQKILDSFGSIAAYRSIKVTVNVDF